MKQIIIVPTWLKMSPGKVVSQCCHAVALAEKEGHGWVIGCRIVLKVDSPDELLRIIGQASQPGIDVQIFADSAPTTENTAGKVTAVVITGIDSRVNSITKELELY